jgi:RimJ/RimL family protein N-acetyltransferase
VTAGADLASVELRTLQPTDEGRMLRLFHRLSPETIYRRFLTSYSDPEPLRPLLQVDDDSRVAVAAIDSDGEIVGVARYGRLTGEPSTAEVAVVVQDSHQGRGLGTQLLQQIGDRARAGGVRRLVATVLADNHASVRMLRRVFPELTLRREGGLYEIDIDLGAGPSGALPPA